jgi:hypothetical protein
MPPNMVCKYIGKINKENNIVEYNVGNNILE